MIKILLMSSLQMQKAVVSEKTKIACADEKCSMNTGTSNNLEPKGLSQINLPKAEQ